MANFDWIVVGAGITGAALSYELLKQGFSVLLLDSIAQFAQIELDQVDPNLTQPNPSQPNNATRYSYGGIAYWSGTTDLTRQLCAEGIEIYRSLSEELAGPTEFRELDLLLTIPADVDPNPVAQSYASFAIPPRLLSVEEAIALEPLLNPAAISGALTVKHGHMNPTLVAQSYIQAFQRGGGTVQAGQVTEFLREQGQVTGVACGAERYQAKTVVVCAGALSRSLLRSAGVSVRLYFTHAEILATPPVDLRLQTLVMPAINQRFQLEANASTAELDPLWDEPGHEPLPPILDAGAIQFLDGHLRLGQTSRTLTDPHAPIDPVASETWLRNSIGHILPKLQDLPGTWHHCQIAFSCDKLPLVGAVPGVEGLAVFSGFSNPLAIVPPLARRFAVHAAQGGDSLLGHLSPDRFSVPR